MIDNGIVTGCSKYIGCREMWEQHEFSTKIPFSCKDCVGYECYCRGYSDGARDALKASNEVKPLLVKPMFGG